MSKLFEFLETEAKHLMQAGLLCSEPLIVLPQGPTVIIASKQYVNLTSSDYLGFANHPEVKKAAVAATESWGVGVASPRMATGTLPLHEEVERALAEFVGTDAALLFPSGYHANTGLLESLLSDRDYVFVDEQARPSLADGIRLCRARAYTYRNMDMNHLEDRLKRSRAARFRVIVTDGVFPLSGLTSHIAEIHTLADRYDAVVAVDDSHGIGVLGKSGRGTHRQLGLTDKIDVVTGSFGHALGGGGGGFIAGKKQIITWLRQKSRPYLSSTALAPAACAAALRCLELLRADPGVRETLASNVRLFRKALHERGFARVAQGEHPSVAIPIGDAVNTQRLTDFLFRKNVYAIGYCHPVVPEGQARIRAQVTARHTEKDLTMVANVLAEGAKKLELDLKPAV